MKKRLIILLLLFTSISYGQEYALWVSTRDYLSGQISDEFYHSGVSDSFINTKVDIETGFHIYKNNLLPLDIKVSQSWKYSHGTLCSFYKELEVNKYEYFVAGYNGVFELCIKQTSKIPSDLSKFYFFSVLLPHYIQPTDNSRSKNDVLFKTNDNTFTDPIKNIPEIIWKYNYNNQGFKDFPNSIKHAFPMKATVAEILINENIEASKPLIIKAQLDNTSLDVIDLNLTPSNTKLPIISTPNFNFNIISASPELALPIIATATKCNYSKDGGFTVNFKRNLYTSDNENIVISLYNKDNIIIGQEFTDTLINNGDGTYGYIWPKRLDADVYTIKYQTHNKNEGIDDKDDSWKSLIHSDEFTIGKPSKVTFSITNTSDETCFALNNGYIDVNANGESTRTFLYQLKREGKEQVYNGTNWVDYSGFNAEVETWYAFINAKNTRISKLGKGSYQVKVKDSQECFAREN